MNYQGAGRGNWTFQYTAGQLAFGATKQKEFRQAKVTEWKGWKDRTMAEIKTSGIEITEDVMTQLNTLVYSKSLGHNAGPKVQIKPDLVEKLTKCVQKVDEHERLANEYEGWIQTLLAQPDKSLDVTQADFLFFFINVKDIPGVSPSDKLGPILAQLASAPPVVPLDVPVFQLQPPGGTGIPAMTAPPLKAKTKKADAAMLSVPNFGPGLAPALTPVTPAPIATLGNIFVPPDFDDTSPEASFPLDDFPED